MESRLKAFGTCESAGNVTERVHLYPFRDFTGIRCRWARCVAAVRLRLEVEAGTVWETIIPYYATHVIDGHTIIASREGDVAGRWIHAGCGKLRQVRRKPVGCKRQLRTRVGSTIIESNSLNI